MATILITGSKGQLGNELQLIAKRRPEHKYIFVDVDELDITDRKAVAEFFRRHQFDICINCAAYTAVDKAESEKEIAHKINVEGVENLAFAIQQNDGILFHISTDFVFDGNTSATYDVDHPVNPLSVYGATKAEGEYRALSVNRKTILIRTSWVYSFFGNNFVKTMIRLGKERSELNVVDDQVGAPTYAGDLADVIFKFIDRLGDIEFGIYHYSNLGKTSWYGFADEIMKLYGLNCKVNPIPTEKYPTPATRPKYSLLNTNKTVRALDIEIPEWQTSLKYVIQLLKNNEMLEKIDVNKIISIAEEAGKEIMKIYETDDFAITDKSDNSPLTKADKAGNAVIINALKESYPDIPIISEENKMIEYSERKDWKYFWLVDPLDGTKEFIKKNGEFTVNIALIRDGKPVLGVVGIPAKNQIYYAVENMGAYKIDETGKKIKLEVNDAKENEIALIGSRSHPSPEFDAYLKEMESKFTTVNFVPAGSSLKFCLVAEGKADVYPRLGPTMEWDTAAGHALVLEAGARVKIYGDTKDLQYNKESLLNPFFIVERNN
ncbi:MAG: 3'(2'),5'-bisphosphate nucleotidase CysQ [Chitinophagales bacterium]